MSQGRRLRVLHLTAGSDAGGVSRYIHDLCQAMVAEGHEVAVAGEKGAWHWLFKDAPWPWIEVPLKGNVFALRRAVNELGAFLKTFPVDVIHTHYRRATLVARRLQRDRPAPVLYTLHLSHVAIGGFRRWLTDFGDHTHVAATDARQWLIDAARVPAAHITLIPHGIDVARYTPTTDAQRREARRQFGLPDDATVGIFVGRLDHPKNEDWLVDLVAATRESLPRLRVLLAGEGPHERPLRQRIEREGLTGRVILLGHHDPLPVYRSADALLLPSTREGFSYVCAEAMATGVPVLRTRTSGSSDLIHEGVTGRTTAIDKQAFLQAARPFLADSVGLRAMGAAAAALVHENHRFEKQVARTCQLYAELASGVRPR